MLGLFNMNKQNQIWFRRKSYGWGWTPVTWQGWGIIAVWLAIFTTSISLLDHEWIKNIVVTMIATAALVYVSYKKGETPRWQWGSRSKLPKWATTVTPFSKYLALSMLVIFPIISFLLGMKYQELLMAGFCW